MEPHGVEPTGPTGRRRVRSSSVPRDAPRLFLRKCPETGASFWDSPVSMALLSGNLENSEEGHLYVCLEVVVCSGTNTSLDSAVAMRDGTEDLEEKAGHQPPLQGGYMLCGGHWSLDCRDFTDIAQLWSLNCGSTPVPVPGQVVTCSEQIK